MNTKIKAQPSAGPTREISLLMAAPSPAFLAGIDRISAVVNGATSNESPKPKMVEAGNRTITYDSGGRKGEGLCGTRCQGVVVAGMRAYQRTPSAMIAGPTAMNQRDPIRPASPPNRAERKVMKSEPGMPASPAAAAVYPTH